MQIRFLWEKKKQTLVYLDEALLLSVTFRNPNFISVSEIELTRNRFRQFMGKICP